MQTKLTLRLENKVIKRAKLFAQRKGKSLSQIVADYFLALEAPPGETKKQIDSMMPITSSLKGILRQSKLTDQAYKKYLEDKYL